MGQLRTREATLSTSELARKYSGAKLANKLATMDKNITPKEAKVKDMKATAQSSKIRHGCSFVKIAKDVQAPLEEIIT